MKGIEQIYCNKIIFDTDEKLSRIQIIEILKQDFNIINFNNPYTVIINNTEIKLYVKQVTYLGHPHLAFKKRIQISRGWEKELQDENSFLIGLYKYKNTVIYVFFDKKNYINRLSNNSSAHVSTFDLLNAVQNNIFTKIDNRGNAITAVKKEMAYNFLEKLVRRDVRLDQKIILFDDFKNTLKQKYSGIECYTEMIEAKFKNRFQPEWVGFYLEFKFQSFLEEYPNLKIICQYQSNKRYNDIDLDLNFNGEFLGDLKAHSNESSAILGNDKKNVENALKLYEKIWYVVFSHNTQKDSINNHEVTLFWNKQQNKNNNLSYSTKMKNNITFTDFKILEINNYNKKYLSDFNQGKNSNGLMREPKIKIDKKSINNFLVYTGIF